MQSVRRLFTCMVVRENGFDMSAHQILPDCKITSPILDTGILR